MEDSIRTRAVWKTRRTVNMTLLNNQFGLGTRCLKISLLFLALSVLCIAVSFAIWFPSQLQFTNIIREVPVPRYAELQVEDVSTEPTVRWGTNDSVTNIGIHKLDGKSNAPLGNFTLIAGRKVVVQTVTNAAFLDFTENWLESVRRIAPLPFTLIMAEDETSYAHLANISDIHVIRADKFSSSKKLNYRTPEYVKMVKKRPQYIVNLLMKGYDVLYSDVDTVWLQDPFPYFVGGEYDVFGQPDGSIICTGFMYFKSNNKTIQLMKLWSETMGRTKEPNQFPFNRAMNSKKVVNLTVKVLDKDKFLSGKDYFKDEWRKARPNLNPVIVHNNYVVGHDEKVKRFKRVGMWYIDNKTDKPKNITRI